jgi:hypothetical protein
MHAGGGYVSVLLSSANIDDSHLSVRRTQSVCITRHAIKVSYKHSDKMAAEEFFARFCGGPRFIFTSWEDTIKSRYIERAR